VVWGHEILLLVGVVCVVVSLDCWSIVVAARERYLGCWQHVCFVAHACNTMIVMLIRNSITSGNKQTIFSHYYYSFLLHNIIITTLHTATSDLRSQYGMFDGATSFDQPHLYCNWQSKSASFTTFTNACDGTVTCGWGDDTCPPTTAPTPSPTAAPTPSPIAASTANGGGGKAAAIYFLYY
jgi:hypothetical protein